MSEKLINPDAKKYCVLYLYVGTIEYIARRISSLIGVVTGAFAFCPREAVTVIVIAELSS